MDGENFGFFYELRASNDVRTNRSREEISIGESEATSGIAGM